MHDAYFIAERVEITHHVFIALFQITVIHFLGFGNERVDNVCLPSEFQFLLDKFVDLQAFILESVVSRDWFPARWQLVDHGYVQIPVQRHCQRSRNRGGGHDQHVGRNRVLLPEFGTLGDAEPMLLVDYDKPDIFETNHVFQ